MPIRLVLVDDHAPFRSYLAALLAQQPDLEVVGDAADPRTLLSLMAALGSARSPDVLLIDVEMPGGGGAAAARALLASYPAVRILALSMHDDPVFVAAMMAAGACGYMLKSDSLGDIAAAIREVAAGRNCFSPALGNMEARSPHRAD